MLILFRVITYSICCLFRKHAKYMVFSFQVITYSVIITISKRVFNTPWLILFIITFWRFLSTMFTTFTFLNLLKYDCGPSKFLWIVNGYTLYNKLRKRTTNRKTDAWIAYYMHTCIFLIILNRNLINTLINLRNKKSSQILFYFKSATLCRFHIYTQIFALIQYVQH